MENRFRREKNISSPSKEKSPEKNNISVDTDNVKVLTPEAEIFVHDIKDAYKQMKISRSIKNVVLLFLVSLLMTAVTSYVLPILATFKFNFTQIASTMTPPGSDEVDITKSDLDILILGRGGNGNDAPDLTDAIIYGHYDVDTQSFVTISIPRDLMIKSRTLGTVKINEVYSTTKRIQSEEAAFQAVMETVSDIVGKKINHYVLLDFSAFRSLIDQVGGVDILVPDRLYDPEYPGKNWSYTTVDIPAGMQHFDGEKALKYARSRHTTSDFDRSKRQQLVLAALREKITNSDILTSPRQIEGIYTILRSSLKTDFSLSQILSILKVFRSLEGEKIIGHSLDVSCFEAIKLCHPGGLLYTPDRALFNGASVILPKKATINKIGFYDDIRIFAHIITTYPTISHASPIAVINASGRTNLALNVALKLHALGLPISDTLISNQKAKSPKSFIRYTTNLTPDDKLMLEAISLVFSGEKRPATPEEAPVMLAPYELVLGSDASLYF